MKTYPYVIIGGGMTGSAAAMGIRKNDPDDAIAMFSEEEYRPYNRPPLTKSLWDGKDIQDIMRPLDKYDVDLFLKTPVRKISPSDHWIETETGQRFKYNKLLLATGGTPTHLPNSPDGVIFYRTLADYHHLKSLTETKDRYCVIGGGFIGSEIAAALTKQGKKVTMIFPESGIAGLRFPDNLTAFLNQYYREKGVTIQNEYLVKAITKDGETYQVRYQKVDGSQTVEDSFDVVIVGVGIKPNTHLAEDCGIKVDNGIVVNEFLQTDHPDIFAAGDVANFNLMGLDKRIRVEHEDNANTMGMIAGLNMSGDMQKYDHFPFFYSDLFDLGYEAVGELDKNLDVYEDWIEPFKEGTIFYLDQGKIRGLIFWNLWGKVDEGRALILAEKTYKNSELPGLFEE